VPLIHLFLTTEESPTPLRLMFDKLVEAPARSSAAIALCGSVVIALALSALVGWTFATRVLVQPSDAFHAMRPMSAVAFLLLGIATIAMARKQYKLILPICLAVVTVALIGAVLALFGIHYPLDAWLEAQSARMGIMRSRGITPTIVASMSAYAISLMLLRRPDVGRRQIVGVYAVGIALVAQAGIVAIVHVSELRIGNFMRALLAAGLQPLLATALLGIALVLLVSRARAVPTSPPRWVPVFASAAMATLVVVLWLVLRADDFLDEARQ
jgi:hypothetical protein